MASFNANIDSDGSRERPLETVEPLVNPFYPSRSISLHLLTILWAGDLGLTVDTSCSRNDSDCVANLVDSYSGGQNILICWEHGELTNIVQSLGDNSPPTYPSNRYVTF